MSGRRRTGGLLGLLALLALGGCVREERVEGPNVVIVTLDTTRADRLGAMGDESARTPVLDGLAGQGVLFRRAYSPVSLTLPAHTTLLSGFDPLHHGVHDNNRNAVPEALETLPQRLGARGYESAAFVAAVVLDATFGLDRGFDVYDDDIAPKHGPISMEVPSRRGEVISDRALTWLAERSGARPFFLWAHYYDVHEPRVPPAPYDEMGDEYAGELAYVDEQVGRLLEGVAAAAGERETLIIVIGDHGESLGEHGEPTHGILAYDSTLHVPLIVSGPGFAPGGVWDGPVHSIDIAPTVLAAVGEAPIPGSRGVPLQERQAREEGADLGWFASRGAVAGFGWEPIEGVRTGRYKFTATPEPIELYDVVEDPGETENLAEARPELAAELAARWKRLVQETPVLEAPSAALSPELAEQLEALGYTGGALEEAVGDPRKHIQAVELAMRARSLAALGRVPDSIQLLEILTEFEVTRLLAMRHLVILYAAVERFDDAVAAQREMVAARPEPTERLLLARLLLFAGKVDDGLAVIDAMLEEGALPPGPQTRRLQAQLLIMADRVDEGLAIAEELLAEDPTDDRALVMVAGGRAGRFGAEEEIPRLRAAIEAAPHPERMIESRLLLAQLLLDEGEPEAAEEILGSEELPEYLEMLAEIAQSRGDLEAAAGHHEAIIEQRPTAVTSLEALVAIRLAQGRMDEALEHSETLVAVAPEEISFVVERGGLHLRAGRLAEAEADYRRAIELDPEVPEPHLNLALVLLASSREGEAEKELLRAVELRPDYGKAHFHLARLYAGKDDPRAAHHAELAAVGGVGTQMPGGAMPAPTPEIPMEEPHTDVP